ncbi:MAG TPA: YciI family protein [Pyrinomonadaceae bacterium]|nr:YciI family protein [Pyrinomonadaceae bacterium]
MRTLISLFVITILLTFQPWTPAQQSQEPQFKLAEFQMALFKKGPKWPGGEHRPAMKQLHAESFAYFQSLLESGKAIIGGPLEGGGDIIGIYVLRPSESDKEAAARQAREWAEADPTVKAGYLQIEMVPWWADPEALKRPTSPLKMTTLYLGFLRRGDKWTPQSTPETQELQKAHLANIRKLWEMKKLVIAGPFGGNGELRGIFVFKVDTLEEAKSLAETDPAVKAGRLAIAMHPWLVPEGILP